MDTNFPKSDTRMPRFVLKDLGEYLKPKEVIADVIHEAYVPSIDFRWIILTNQRVIIAKRTILATHLNDINLNEMEITLERGVFYDIVLFQMRMDQYRGSFYATDRAYTMDFVNKIKAAQYQMQQEEEQAMSEASAEPIQTLEDLAELRDRGIVSDAEFEAAKKEFLRKFRKEKEES
jgi:hypothetical protein